MGNVDLPPPVPPMLAVPGPLPLGAQASRWAFEFKWDGVRATVALGSGQARVWGRRGRESSKAWPEVAELAAARPELRALLDGELVALDRAGRPSFELLQTRMHLDRPADVARARSGVPAVFLAFDLLHIDGRDTLELAYADRRALLEGLELAGASWQTPPSWPGGGAEVLATAQAQRLEGVVAKRLDSRYEPGRRSDCWVKHRILTAADVVVGGWTPGEGRRAGGVGALVIGQYDAGGLRFVGRVGSGLSERALVDLTGRLAELETPSCPFADPLTRADAPGARWVRPELVARVHYAHRTRDGRLRFPTYQGLRTDVAPEEVTLDD